MPRSILPRSGRTGRKYSPRNYSVIWLLSVHNGLSSAADQRTTRQGPPTGSRPRALEGQSGEAYVKPFHLPELIARIRSVLRRAGRSTGPGRIAIGPIWADPETRRAGSSSGPLELKPRECELLVFLLRHPGRVWTREQLLDRVWGSTYEGEVRTVDSHIRRLRALIEEDPGDPHWIETVWGVGYRMCEEPVPIR